MYLLIRGLRLRNRIETISELTKSKLAVVCIVIISTYFLFTAFIYLAELFHWQTGPLKWDSVVGAEYEPPSRKNLFGTDYLGRSVLRKTIYAAKVSITVAFWASLISFTVGVCLGAIAGYFRGFVDDIIVWLLTTLTSVPYILLILAFALVLSDKSINLFGLDKINLTGIPAVCLAIGLTGWTGICRLIRAEVIRQKQFNYVLTAKSKGCSNMRILFGHILPNVSHIVIITFSLRFVYYIHAEVMLSFLGVGAKNVPSWGSMIDAARVDLTRGCWWEMTAATAAIFIISLALNIFADKLRQYLDPKLRIL
jgi:ABC-type dipeptide/oligopeptide/nickel transport system permease subunit